MYEPIFLGKVREARTVTIPAGGWIILGSPDDPLSASIDRRAALVKKGNVSDEFAAVIIGRIQDTHTPTKFLTSKEAKANDALQQSHQDSLTQSHADALKRQQDRTLDDQKRRAADHAARVEDINAENDATRNRGRVVETVATAELETKTEERETKSLNEFTVEALNALERGDLLKLAQTLVDAGRIDTLPEGKKSDVIAAILAAKAKSDQ